MSSRGCPYQCTYCFEPKFNVMYAGKGPIFNRYSVARLCAELKELKERWPTQFVKFYDDMFILDRKVDAWLEEFAESIRARWGYRSSGLTRWQTSSPARTWRRSSARAPLAHDVDRGRQRVRAEHRREAAHEAAADPRRLRSSATRRASSPSRTRSWASRSVPRSWRSTARRRSTNDIENLDINIRCRVTYAEFPVLHPYPGCELTDYAVRNGFFDGDFDRLFYSYQARARSPASRTARP